MQQSEIDAAIQSIYEANCQRGPNAGGGMFPNEYAMAAKTIMENPGNVLVFGLGNDSWLWAALCKDRETGICFVEDDAKWAEAALSSMNKALGCIRGNVWFTPVIYCPKPYRKHLVYRFTQYGSGPVNLPLLNALARDVWSVIIVDAPTGERLESLYTARLLALRSPACSVLIHDYTRDRSSIELAFNNHPVAARERELVLLRHDLGELPCLGWERGQV